MDADHRELILGELRNARDRLRACRALIEVDLPLDAISRAYYAVFHAAKALLLHRGISVESHAGLKAMFGLHLVDTGVVSRRLGRILGELMERRESSDYDVWNALDIEDARRSLDAANEFVQTVEAHLRAPEPAPSANPSEST